MPATGPTSQIGKSKMRENPLKHGLTAKHIVIPGESEQEYTALRIDLFDSYQPVTASEEVLTNQIVEGYWRLMRARKVETDFWTKHMETPGKTLPAPEGYPVRRPPSDYDEALGRAFRKHADEHTRMHRYLTTIERNYYKAIRELRTEQALRQERYNAQQPAQPESVSQNSKQSDPPTESASQKAPAITHQPPNPLIAAGHPSVPVALPGGQCR